jgi:hypothetical protein
VTDLDWVILGFTALLAFYGYLQGFLVGMMSLVGFVIGAFLGTRVAPLLLHQGSRSPYAPLFGLVGALLLGGLFSSGMEGIGSRVRMVLRIPGFKTLDGLLGAVLTACVALGIAWIVGAVALDTTGSGSVRSDIRASKILRDLDRMLPPSGPVLDALARFDPLPSVHGPAADVDAPDREILDRAGPHRAAHSVVKVFGMACGLGVEGSGWVAAPDLVVTNAHVVAGEHDTEIQVQGAGPGLPVQIVAFDVHDDLAVLRIAHLPLRPLTLVSAPTLGTAAAILGYPEDGPFKARAGRLGQTESVDTQDAYGDGHVHRSISALRGLVQPGNSGGPLVNAQGQVLATVFAAITGTARPGGFAVPNSVVAQVLARARARTGTVGTGHCAD